MAKQTINNCQTCGVRKSSVFCDLSKEHLSELTSSKVTNTYKPHQAIFYEGNLPYGVYCVSSGKIKIYKMDSDGHQQIVRLAGPGDILGYRCFITQEPYSATAETIENSVICFIDKSTFYHLMESHPKTALNIMTLLAQDLKGAEDKVVSMVHKNVRTRFAELLMSFKMKYGQKMDGGILLNITLTREEMAEIIGTTTESVIRTMSELKENGIIRVEGRKITICKPTDLAEAANLID